MTRRYFSLILLAVVVLLGCEEPPASKAVRPVRAMRIGDTGEFSRRSLPGQASAAEEVNLAFRVSGPLIELPVEVGQEVQAADILGQIDPADFQIALEDANARLDRAEQTLLGMRTGRPEDIRLAEKDLAAAEADFNKAEAEFERQTQLLANNATSQSEYDRSEADFKVADSAVESAQENLAKIRSGARVEDIAAKEAEIRSLNSAVEKAKNQLNYTTLKAPFDGTIAATFVENFQTVQANQLIVRLLDKSSIEVTISLPEQSVRLIQFVKKIDCVFDAFPDKTFSGTIKEVATEASSSTRTYPVTIAIEQQHADDGVTILPGMACSVAGQVELPEEGFIKGVEVPETAILDQANKKSVWIVDESTGTVSRQEVTVGELTPYGIRIEGVDVGQVIVTAGVHYLQPGQQVRLMLDDAV